MCGGTQQVGGWLDPFDGLSPRVRGNRWTTPKLPPNGRSIPACAGEPIGVISSSTMASVYPRVCGGTSPSAPVPVSARGLSPRVRGNPVPLLRMTRSRGSIPACAGEPLLSRLFSSSVPVYPRVCGGTVKSGRKGLPGTGLSPRVRGNHYIGNLRHIGIWSIPACAGEPDVAGVAGNLPTVYPRVCGGTVMDGSLSLNDAYAKGLSPRVRGNQLPVAFFRQGIRSIPACAGEPQRYANKHSG